MRKNEFWQQYIEYLKSKSLSTHTIATRNRSLKKFLLWLNARGFAVQEVIEEDIYNFSEALRQNLKTTTVKTHLSTLKSFYGWMYKNSFMLINPMEHFSNNFKMDKLPDILTVSEINSLFEKLPINTTTAKRNKAMLELAYSALLRREELINVKISDLNFTENIIRVDRKGNKEALLPFGTEAHKAIFDYLEHERDNESDSEYLWLDYKTGEKLSYSAVDKIFKGIRKSTGFNLSAHTLRRSGATHMLQNGASLQIIQEMLSHENLKTVKHYLRLCTKDYHETLNKSELLK